MHGVVSVDWLGDGEEGVNRLHDDPALDDGRQGMDGWLWWERN
jgi:hypothetical protein